MNEIRQAFVDVARREIGVKELSKNMSPRIMEYWRYTSYPEGGKNREPWCAAFMCFVVAQGAQTDKRLAPRVLPQAAACNDWIEWANGNGAIVFKPHDGMYFPACGDIVLYRFGNHPRYNHIGVVVSFDGDTVYTVEGNTNEEGGRDGDGVYSKERSLNICAAFIRTAVRTLEE